MPTSIMYFYISNMAIIHTLHTLWLGANVILTLKHTLYEIRVHLWDVSPHYTVLKHSLVVVTAS